MKFDPFIWQEVEADETYESKTGHVRIMCSAPANLYVEAQGVEVLAGFGQEIKIETREVIRFRIEAPKGTRCFVESPPDRSIKVIGEVFTNLDRMPMESGSVAEVTREMRRFKLEQAGMLREMRAERHKLNRERAHMEKARSSRPDPETPEAAQVQDGEKPDDEGEAAAEE